MKEIDTVQEFSSSLVFVTGSIKQYGNDSKQILLFSADTSITLNTSYVDLNFADIHASHDLVEFLIRIEEREYVVFFYRVLKRSKQNAIDTLIKLKRLL